MLVSVDVDTDEVIGDISTRELREELESRSREGDTTPLPLPDNFDAMTGRNSEQLLETVYEERRNGNDARALELVDRLIYAALGRIV